MRELQREQISLPDLVIVATDADCKGFAERKKELDDVTGEGFKHLVIYAIPDPHIERWLLLDSAAFKSALGRGCNAPDLKCSRDRYKQVLLEEMQDAGVSPPLGGIEYASDIVAAMDLDTVERADVSFGKLLRDLLSLFNKWKSE